MIKDQKLLDELKNEFIPMLNRLLEMENIHLKSMKQKLKDAKNWNSKWYVFFKIDISFIEECVMHSEIIIKHLKSRIKEFNEFITKNNN